MNKTNVMTFLNSIDEYNIPKTNELDKILFNIPHSSIYITDKTGYVIDPKNEIEKLTDWHVDKIFDVEGITKLIFPYSRVFCDVERFEDDSMEIEGYGFFYTQTDDCELLRKDIDGIKNKVLEEYYKPYHKKLEEEVQNKLDNYDECLIVDCHTFSDKPFKRDIFQSNLRPDICLGTNSIHTPDYLKDNYYNYFEKEGYSVDIDYPYLGTIVPKKFIGNDKVKSILIEINRKLYLNNKKGFEKIKKIIKSLFTI